jgi:hypothetical protein
MTTIRFSEEGDVIIMRFVFGKLPEKCLSKMPQSDGSILGAIGGGVEILTTQSADEECIVLLRNIMGEICHLNRFILGEVDGEIGEDIIRISDLIGLIDE